LARAHLDALNYLEQENRQPVFNVGTGTGASVIEVLEKLREVSGQQFEIEYAEPRAGDPPKLVAAVDLIAEHFGFTAKQGLDEIIKSAWAAANR
jgi:UDP-glucose 4-epimerase